jgi:hypothetical protein
MVMDWHNTALAMAGVLGSSVAIVHGALTQRLMVGPIEAAAKGRISGPIRRIVPALLHFSTFNWFVGGLALVAAACMLEPQARQAIALLVGSSYLSGAVGTCWATRGRHPGWMLYAIALALIAYGLEPGIA